MLNLAPLHLQICYSNLQNNNKNAAIECLNDRKLIETVGCVFFCRRTRKSCDHSGGFPQRHATCHHLTTPTTTFAHQHQQQKQQQQRNPLTLRKNAIPPQWNFAQQQHRKMGYFIFFMHLCWKIIFSIEN